MASKIFREIQTLQRGVKILQGSFRPNGTSAVDNTLNKGKGFTVARTGVGDFTITLDDAWNHLVAAQVALMLAAAADSVVILGPADVTTATGGTVELFVLTAGSSADIASDADNWVHFTLHLGQTSGS